MTELNQKKEAEFASSPEKSRTVSPAVSPLDDEHHGINEKALLRKLDLRLLPPLTILYLLSFLDRSNGTDILAEARRFPFLMTHPYSW
jgi:hypothetical protein